MTRLREWRERRFLSLRDLARESGVSAAAISRLEAKKTRAIPRTAKRLAAALGVEPVELYGREPAALVAPLDGESRCP